MARPPKGLSPEDRALWEAYIRDVDRVFDGNRVRVSSANQAPEATRTSSHRLKSSSPVAHEKPLVKPARKQHAPHHGLDSRTHRKVVRGRIGIDARIDLHNMRQAEAHRALINFIRSAAMRGDKTVLVITGKGRASMEDAPWWEAREKGVLRRLVPVLLRQRELSPYVIGCETASRAHGGEGALYVRLRRPKR